MATQESRTGVQVVQRVAIPHGRPYLRPGLVILSHPYRNEALSDNAPGSVRHRGRILRRGDEPDRWINDA